uniref:PIR Superfamily Protein n=1 Tax=Syphacia muris TaxID=451379 RepID=A0A0N5AJI2_9BILA
MKNEAVVTICLGSQASNAEGSLPISKGIDNCPDSVRAPCAVLPQQSYHECDYGANNYIMELENDNKKLKHENQYFKNLFYSYLISNDSAENQPCTPKATETFSEETYTYTTL